MNRFISIGLAVAVAPAILVVIGRSIGSEDAVHVASGALRLTVPLGGLLAVVGLFTSAIKKKDGSTAEVREADASKHAAKSDLDTPHGATGENRFVRYARFVAACFGLFVLLTPFALVLSSFTSHQTAAKVLTPLFWLCVGLVWFRMFGR
jgi:hypothetical protein